MSSFLRLRRSALALVLLATLACGGGAPSQAQDRDSDDVSSAPAPPTLATATALGVANAHEPTAGLLTAGQLTEEQMAALAEAGYTTFISLRAPEESGAGWEEAYAAQHGLAFTRLSIAGAGDLSQENVTALDAILDAANGPTVLYCGSANRVGAMLALRANWLDGIDAAQALDFGKAAGMTRLEPAVVQLLGLGGAS